MEVFFNKHHKDVTKLCNTLADEISDTFKIDREDLGEFMDAFLQKPNKVQCEGRVVSKNNTRCTCMAIANEIYCKRHLYLKDKSSTDERPRCSGIMKRGVQCVHQATYNSAFCKKHMYQQDDDTTELVTCAGITANGDPCTRVVKNSGEVMCQIHIHKSPHRCVHYKLDTDGNEVFVCDRLSVINQWCCTSHDSMNKLYSQNFRAKSIKDYLSQVALSTRDEHPMLSDRYPACK